MSTGGWIFLLVVAGLIIAAVAGYNKLVGLRQRSEEAWSDIDVQLKRRTDLIPNLVETVKGYAAHERGTLDAVVRARGAAMTAQTPDTRASLIHGWPAVGARGSARVVRGRGHISLGGGAQLRHRQLRREPPGRPRREPRRPRGHHLRLPGRAPGRLPHDPHPLRSRRL